MNLYAELVETRTGKDVGSMMMTPGLVKLFAIGPGPIRGMHLTEFQFIVISGSKVFLMADDFTGEVLGSMDTSVGPVSMIDNGVQIAFFDGVKGYLIAPRYGITALRVTASGGVFGSSYAPGNVIHLAGGTYRVQGAAIVLATQLTPSASGVNGVSGVNILAPGGGWTKDKVVNNITCTGGTGHGATFTGTSDGSVGGATSITPLNAGVGYTAGDVLYLNHGTGTTVTVTQVGSSGVVAAGAGGTPGPVTLTGTTGVGRMFQMKGTINGTGNLVSIDSYTDLGSYTTNPTLLGSEPVTGGGLVGARVALTMGVQTVDVQATGIYTSRPTLLTQDSASGAGINAEFEPTFEQLVDANPFSTLDLPFSGPVTAVYTDGFGLVNEGGTQKFWQSDLSDLSTWNALNFSSADSSAGDLVAMGVVNRELWLTKRNDTEIWINAGLPNFAFQRLSGAYVQEGCIAPYSLVRCGSSLIWLGRSKEGQGQVMMSNGYQVAPISTHALQFAFSKYPSVTDAIAFCYQDEGHVFYVLTFPSGDATWCYDITASEELKIPMWHERPFFQNGEFHRHLSNCFLLRGRRLLVGDYRNGNVYSMSLQANTDNGVARKWVRSWRALRKPTTTPVSFNSLTIDMQTGMGVNAGTNPQCVLRWSDDGGHTWSNERIKAVGKVGETARRVKFNRLGSTRRNSGLDRIFELSSTDVFDVCLIGADVE